MKAEILKKECIKLIPESSAERILLESYLENNPSFMIVSTETNPDGLISAVIGTVRSRAL